MADDKRPSFEDPSGTTSSDEQMSGVPGDGAGRVDETGHSGVWPATGPTPDEELPYQPAGSWGQGAAGGAGYEDSGSSELHPEGPDVVEEETRE
jgi:hypothetical protein